jgi:membrane-associated phospholipid phosphatase
MRPALALLLALAAAGLAPRSATAEPGPDVDGTRATTSDAVIAGVSLLGAFALSRIHTRPRGNWSRQLLSIDDSLEDDFSPRAARVSDVLLVTAIVAPLIPELHQGSGSGERVLIYGETLGVNLLLNAAVKVVVRRPRPYLYNPDPEVRRWGEGQRDARQSFYSGHASTSFAAAVAGGLLTSLATDDATARAFAWGSGFALAGATATLRTRAGKHFYSDVLAGALIGSATGAIIPLLHADPGHRPRPSGLDLAAAAGGLGLGVLAGRLLPAGSAHPRVTARLVPSGRGLGLVGVF